MANPSLEAVDTSSDKLMLIAGVLLVLAGFVGFFWLSGQEWYVRGAALVVGVAAGGVGGFVGFFWVGGQEWYGRGAALGVGGAAGVVVGLPPPPGKGFIAFAKD